MNSKLGISGRFEQFTFNSSSIGVNNVGGVKSYTVIV